MKARRAIPCVAGVFLCASLRVAAQTPAPSTASAPAARGDYLTHSVAMCVQCHSPRDAKGEILPAEEFTGAAIPFTSPFPATQWAPVAPNIKRLPGFTDEQIFMLLTEGHAGDRPSPRRPMPPFRMSPDDARAIIAYLRAR